MTIRELREKKHLSKDQLAHKLHATEDDVNLIEEYGVIAVKFIPLLCRLGNVKPQELYPSLPKFYEPKRIFDRWAA